MYSLVYVIHQFFEHVFGICIRFMPSFIFINKKKPDELTCGLLSNTQMNKMTFKLIRKRLKESLETLLSVITYYISKTLMKKYLQNE